MNSEEDIENLMCLFGGNQCLYMVQLSSLKKDVGVSIISLLIFWSFYQNYAKIVAIFDIRTNQKDIFK